MRKKISENKKKHKTAISIDSNLFEIFDKYLSEKDIKRSKYIENLIREDLKNRGKNVEKEF